MEDKCFLAYAFEVMGVFLSSELGVSVVEFVGSILGPAECADSFLQSGKESGKVIPQPVPTLCLTMHRRNRWEKLVVSPQKV